jgi:hypothetical protein
VVVYSAGCDRPMTTLHICARLYPIFPLDDERLQHLLVNHPATGAPHPRKFDLFESFKTIIHLFRKYNLSLGHWAFSKPQLCQLCLLAGCAGTKRNLVNDQQIQCPNVHHVEVHLPKSD